MDLTHADIKPENILISDNGDICLTDFGLAVFSDDYHSPVTGTRQYSPPEIILGRIQNNNKTNTNLIFRIWLGSFIGYMVSCLFNC